MSKLVIDTNEVFTVEEAATLLLLGRSTMFKYLKEGKIQHLKIAGRTYITKGEIDRYIKASDNGRK